MSNSYEQRALANEQFHTIDNPYFTCGLKSTPCCGVLIFHGLYMLADMKNFDEHTRSSFFRYADEAKLPVDDRVEKLKETCVRFRKSVVYSVFASHQTKYKKEVIDALKKHFEVHELPEIKNPKSSATLFPVIWYVR